MKKSLLFSLIVLFVFPIFVGCKSGFGSCFTRNGSRVPTTAIAETGATSTAIGPAVPYNEVTMMQATSATSSCDPCAPSACSPCDPCGSSRGTANSSYPAAAYPGI